jgi:ankyrin repeat protein
MTQGVSRWPIVCLALVVSLFITVNASGAAVSLVDAVKKADKTTVRALLKQRVDVNGAEPDGTTALHWAARVDDLESADLLLRAGANAKAANRYGVTPLLLACLNGNSAMIERLLKAGADPNTASSEGETALMTASRTGKADAVKVLLGHGAEVDAKESWRGQTALMWAAAEGHVEVIQALIERGADIRKRSSGGFTPFLFAAREGQIGAVEALLKAGASVNDSLPVIARRRIGTQDIASEPETGINAFLLAAGNAHYELANLLLDRGADANSAPQGWTALHQVSWVRKAGIGGSNNPAPQGSGNMDSLEFVRKLVAHGADLNARATKRPNMGVSGLNSLGATPLILAARTADADLMRLLASLGADPKLTNEDNSTVLMVAAGLGTASPGEDPGTEPEVLEAVKVALELGNDVNAIDNNGETAMHGAVYKHAPTVAQYLAAHGAKTDVWSLQNKKGYTPLRIALGIQRGMNIVGHGPSEAMIRQLMIAAGVPTPPQSQ